MARRAASGMSSRSDQWVQTPCRRLVTKPAALRRERWWLIVGCPRSKTSVKSTTHTGVPAARSRWSICTRVGSATALSAAASAWASRGGSSGASGIDFAGYTIDAIHLTLSESFSVIPNTVLDRTVTTGSVFVEVFGHVVPEPSTALLVGIGLAGLLLPRRASAV